MDSTEGISLGLLAAGAWGVTEVIAAVVARRVGSLRTTAWIQATALLVLVALMLVTGTRLPADGAVIAASLAWGGIGGVAYLAFFTALRLGPVTVVSPIVSMFGGLSVILAVIVLREQVGPVQAVGVAVAVLGVALASIVLQPGGGRPRVAGPGVAYAFVSLLAFGAMTVGLSPVIAAGGWLPVMTLARLGNAATAWAVLGASRASGRWSGRGLQGGPLVAVPLGEVLEPEPVRGGAGAAPARDSRALGGAVVAGVLDAAGFAAFAIGLAVASTWLVGITSSFGPVVTVIAGVALFGERPRRLQWAGLALVLLSVLLIGAG